MRCSRKPEACGLEHIKGTEDGTVFRHENVVATARRRRRHNLYADAGFIGRAQHAVSQEDLRRAGTQDDNALTKLDKIPDGIYVKLGKSRGQTVCDESIVKQDKRLPQDRTIYRDAGGRIGADGFLNAVIIKIKFHRFACLPVTARRRIFPAACASI